MRRWICLGGHTWKADSASTCCPKCDRRASAEVRQRFGVDMRRWEWRVGSWRGSGHRFLHLGPFRFWIFWPYN